MGIYISGMEMPKNCCACPLFKSDMSKQLFCKAFDAFKKSDYDKLPIGRMNNCPLVFVPPHGDLIDCDEMRETIKPWTPEDEITGCTFDTVKKLMHTMISRAPVIIPAESPKEET